LQNLQYGIATAGRCKPYNGKHYQEAVMLLTLGFLCFFSFMAGLIDAAVGGGGLIQTPALFNFLPQYSAATLFGTNKMSSAVGTLVGHALLFAAGAPAVEAGDSGGHHGIRDVVCWCRHGECHPKSVIRPLVLVLLVLMAMYTCGKRTLASCTSR
jgi:hypothetical protein